MRSFLRWLTVPRDSYLEVWAIIATSSLWGQGVISFLTAMTIIFGASLFNSILSWSAR